MHLKPIASPSSLTLTATLVVTMMALGVGGCSCAVGRPMDTDGGVTVDSGQDSGHDTGVDAEIPDAYVDDAMVMVDSGMVNTCGNGVIDTELFEVCDPNLPMGALDALRCICADDGSPCTDDVWVPHPTMGVCYGSCEHPPRSGYGVNTCDDGDSCTIDTITSGDPSTCDVTCTNLPPSMTDTNCNGADDDCNGTPDDGYVSTPTSCGQGQCVSTGYNTCVNGMVVDSCTPGVMGGDDNNCDGADNNCNGAVDEGYQPTSTSCGMGNCVRAGMTACTNGLVTNDCTPGTPDPSDANCNGVDENCNGPIDEGYVSLLTTCGLGACMATGATTCNAGGILTNSCVPGPIGVEVCDSIDNDCDGMVNDGNPGGGLPCMTGNLGRCSAGITNCAGGTIVCVQTNSAMAETCNGEDDDCNGLVDNGTAGASCNTGLLGVCAAGTQVCNGASGLACVQTTMSSAETCDLLDNNCDGLLNNGIPSTACVSTNPGVCSAGTTACTGGMTVCTSNIAPMSQQEVCASGGGPGPGDSLDNDCDGTVDINPHVNDNVPNSCNQAASRTVTVAVGGSTTLTGWVDSNGLDYFVVSFQGATSGAAAFHPKIELTTGGAVHTFSLFTSTTCGTPISSSCGAASGNTYTSFENNYPGNLLGCNSNAGNGNGPTCTDTFARVTSYVVRVQRAAGSPQLNCQSYTFTISN